MFYDWNTSMKISKILFGLSLLVLSWWWVFAITDPAIKNPWLDLYYESPALEYTTPTWFAPVTQEYAPENISYWLDVLPYEQDKYEDMYLVIPWLWLITPIVGIPEWSNDFNVFINGDDTSNIINKYLQRWIIEYPVWVEPWQWWKRIDFGHSNYRTSDPWRYKSIFANLMRLDPGDQVWYFVKQADWSFALHRYNITKSYPTDPSNVQALQWDWDWADALIFWCYHWLDWRRMVEAEYLWEPTGQYIEEEVIVEEQYDNISLSLRNRVKDWVTSINYLWVNAKKYEIIILFKGLQRARALLNSSDPQYVMKSELLDMIENELAKIYPE